MMLLSNEHSRCILVLAMCNFVSLDLLANMVKIYQLLFKPFLVFIVCFGQLERKAFHPRTDSALLKMPGAGSLRDAVKMFGYTSQCLAFLCEAKMVRTQPSQSELMHFAAQCSTARTCSCSDKSSAASGFTKDVQPLRTLAVPLNQNGANFEVSSGPSAKPMQ